MSTATDDAELARLWRHGWRPGGALRAPEWAAGFTEADYRACARSGNELPIPDPLALALRLPADGAPGAYGAGSAAVLDHLHAEIARQGALYDRDRAVVELRVGGAGARRLAHADLAALLRGLCEHFMLERGEAREFAVAADPRHTCRGDLRRLREAGFNRLHLGALDGPPPEDLAALVGDAHALGFRSVALDLRSDPAAPPGAFAAALQAVIAARADRIGIRAVFDPDQPRPPAPPPEAAASFADLRFAAARLAAAGYVHIGLEQHALPGDDLAQARARGALRFGPYGYAPQARADAVGLGAGARGEVGCCRVQNEAAAHYGERLRTGGLAIARGVRASAASMARRALVQQILCQGRADLAALEARHGSAIRESFATGRARFEDLERDGFVRVTASAIEVTARGRPLLGAIADAVGPPCGGPC